MTFSLRRRNQCRLSSLLLVVFRIPTFLHRRDRITHTHTHTHFSQPARHSILLLPGQLRRLTAHSVEIPLRLLGAPLHQANFGFGSVPLTQALRFYNAVAAVGPTISSFVFQKTRSQHPTIIFIIIVVLVNGSIDIVDCSNTDTVVVVVRRWSIIRTRNSILLFLFQQGQQAPPILFLVVVVVVLQTKRHRGSGFCRCGCQCPHRHAYIHGYA